MIEFVKFSLFDFFEKKKITDSSKEGFNLLNNFHKIQEVEPTLLTLVLIPYILNVQLNIYIQEKNVKKYFMFYSCHKSEDIDDAYDINIDLYYKEGGFIIIYSNEFVLRNYSLLAYESLNSVLVKRYNQKRYCNVCKQYLEEILVPYYEIVFCFSCFKLYIDEVLENRAKSMFEDNFLVRECKLILIILIRLLI